MNIETIQREAKIYLAGHDPARLEILRSQIMPIVRDAAKLTLLKKMLRGNTSRKFDYILQCVIVKAATESFRTLKEAVKSAINETICELAADPHTISKDIKKKDEESLSVEEQLEAAYPSMSDRSFVDLASPGKLSQPSNPTIAPPSPESRKSNMAVPYGKESFTLLEDFFLNIEQHFGRKLKGNLDWRNILKDAFEKDLAKYLMGIHRHGKFVYSLARENEIEDYRRLLYSLRIINFPMTEAKEREGQFITANWLPLFNAILPKIKQIWEQKDNVSDWIAHFKKKGWKKARISLFMSRRIQRKLVPPCFFELTNPGILIERSFLDSPVDFMKMVTASEWRTAAFGKDNSYRRKLAILKELCIKCQKTILTAGADAIRS